MSAERRDQILDFAEKEIRKGGFDAVSFRDIAAAIGVKSSSVHYYFATKSDLSVAVTERYTDAFLNVLGDPALPDARPVERIIHLADAYLNAFKVDSATCLCAVLGSTPTHLSPATTDQIRVFYRRVTEWIATAMQGEKHPIPPDLVISLLQGAMVLAVANEDETPLIEAKTYLQKLFE